MPVSNAVIAVFHTHTSAERAICELEESGFEMHKLSMIGKGSYTNEHVVGCYDISGGMKFWGQHAAFWRSLWDTLPDSAVFMLPGLGPIVATLVATMEGAVALRGYGAIGDTLASIGISESNLRLYETDLKIGKLLMIVQGTCEDVEMARRQLNGTMAAIPPPMIDPDAVSV